MHRDRILYAFEKIPGMIKLKPPVFVFAHIFVPHPPFVFGKDGEVRNPKRKFVISDAEGFLRLEGATTEEYVTHYREQLIFTNAKIKKISQGV